MSKHRSCLISILALSFVGLDCRHTWAADRKVTYSKEVAGVLETYCVHCHDGKDAEGDVDFRPSLDNEFSDREHVGLWIKVEKVLSAGIMPPADETQPSIVEKQQFS